MGNEPGLELTYVVDDEKIIASTLAVIIAQGGYPTLSFTNPHDALRSAIAQPPALLITDVIMPEMNGIELAIEFKTKLPRCKVLLLSGQMHTAVLLEKAIERGHDFTVLAKPIHPKDLLATIGRLTP
jgi:CheY-like chemotaxis protein